MPRTTNIDRRKLLLSGTGVLVGVILLGPVWRSVSRSGNSSKSSGPQDAEIKKPIDLVGIASPHLDKATSRSHAIIDDELEPINQFFKASKEGTQKFAELSLSWGSKWRLIADNVPYSKGDRHAEYLRTKFEEHIFTPEQFEKVIRQSVDGYLFQLRSIESQMLVDLRADIAGFPEESSLQKLDSQQWQDAFNEAIFKAQSASSSQLESDVGTQLVSIITGEVLTQVAIRLGVSSGILTTGAASGWATFGVGLVVGIIIDQLVTIAWDHWTDPKGKLAKQLNQKLEEINILIRNGDSKVQGLRSRFRQIADERALLRKTAMMEVLHSYSTGPKP